MAKKMGLNPESLNQLKEKAPKIEMISSTAFEARVPKYRLYKKMCKQTCLIGEFMFPDVVSTIETFSIIICRYSKFVYLTTERSQFP